MRVYKWNVIETMNNTSENISTTDNDQISVLN